MIVADSFRGPAGSETKLHASEGVPGTHNVDSTATSPPMWCSDRATSGAAAARQVWPYAQPGVPIQRQKFMIIQSAPCPQLAGTSYAMSVEQFSVRTNRVDWLTERSRSRHRVDSMCRSRPFGNSSQMNANAGVHSISTGWLEKELPVAVKHSPVELCRILPRKGCGRPVR